MKFKSNFHRKDAKSAEDNAFNFAVDPLKTLADRKDGQHIGQTAQ